MEQLIRTDISQGSNEWYQERLGKITGSSFHKLLSGNGTKEKYIYDRASEIVTGCRSDSDSFTNIHMQRGHSFEAEARSQYVIKTFTRVTEVGLVELGEYVACSPDGLVDYDGVIEIKVPDSNNYFRQLLEISAKGTQAISNEHYIQMQFNMYVCNRKWCDYILYNPQHAVNNKELFIWRVESEEKMQSRISETIDESIIKIKSYVEQYHNMIYPYNI
jgi:exodeoxyribonuclease (lambda-induced)